MTRKRRPRAARTGGVVTQPNVFFGREGHADAARTNCCEEGPRAGCNENQRGLRRRLFENSEKPVGGLGVEPCRIAEDSDSGASLNGGPSQSLVDRSDLLDGDSGFVDRAFDPIQIGMLADMTIGGSALFDIFDFNGFDGSA